MISYCIEELELLAGKLDVAFDTDLRILRERAKEKEESSSDEDDDMTFAPLYRTRPILDADEVVDGIFQNLIDQI